MQEVTAPALEALVMRRRFEAPRERVFAAWTQPEMMRQWMAPFDLTVADVTVDARAGGSYRIAMDRPGKDQWIVGGEFTEIDPPRRLAFTWRGETVEFAHLNTLIELDFAEVGGATELTLTQTKFSDEATRTGHYVGWEATFANLDAILETGVR